MRQPDVAWTSTARALRGPAMVAGIGLAAAALLHVRDPHVSGSYGLCPFSALTGSPCLGCGGLRAVNDLTRGDLVGAVSSNALVVLMVVAASAVWCLWVLRRVRGGRAGPPPVVGVRGALAVLAVLVTFGVLRVTPWGAWFAP